MKQNDALRARLARLLNNPVEDFFEEKEDGFYYYTENVSLKEEFEITLSAAGFFVLDEGVFQGFCLLNEAEECKYHRQTLTEMLESAGFKGVHVSFDDGKYTLTWSEAGDKSVLLEYEMYKFDVFKNSIDAFPFYEFE